MGQISPGPIKNRVRYGFFFLKTQSGSGLGSSFYKKPETRPVYDPITLKLQTPPPYIYSCNVNPISLTQLPLIIWSYFNFTPSDPHAFSLTPSPHISSSQSHSLCLSSLTHCLTRPQAHKQSSTGSLSLILHCRHTVTSLQLSTLSTSFVLTVVDLTIAQPSAPLIFLAHGLTASLHLNLHFFLFSFLGSVRLNVSLCLWFKRENHRSKICVWIVVLKGKIIDLIFVFRISVFMFVIVFGFVFVFVILGRKIINRSLCFWFWAWLGMRGQGPRRPDRAGLGLRKKPV